MSVAEHIWDDLLTRYSHNNMPRMFNLRKELASLTQGTKNIYAYFTQYHGLIDELESLDPIPRCICATNSCTCEMNVKLDMYEHHIQL